MIDHLPERARAAIRRLGDQVGIPGIVDVQIALDYVECAEERIEGLTQSLEDMAKDKGSV